MSDVSEKYETRTVYFTNYPSKRSDAWKRSMKNTRECCRLAVERTAELGIKQVVVSSDTGFSARIFMEELKKKGLKDVKVIVEAGMYGERGPNQHFFEKENREKLEEMGVKVVFATSTFAGLSRAVRWRFGTIQLAEIIAAVYKTIAEGVKVAVEIAIACSDTGDLVVGEKCISIGGTSRGADTAVVLTPCNSFAFFDGKWGMKIHEIICMPECRTPKRPSAFDYVTHKTMIDYVRSGV
jgi:hypothetical protein